MKRICCLTLLMSVASPLFADEGAELANKSVRVLYGQGADDKVDDLAGRLAEGFRGGQLTRDQLDLLAKSFAALADARFSIDNCKACVKRLESVVQISGLSKRDRLQLYQEVLNVMETARLNPKE